MISCIEGPSSLSSATPVRRASKAKKTEGSTSFSKHLDALDDAGGVQGAGALGAVSGVLDIQEVDDALDRAARGKLRAEDMLKKLDELRLGILSGTLSRQDLQRLSDTVTSRKDQIDDPALAEILDEIDLRAQVELAKFTRV